jgi:hypothetical protein
MLFNFLRPFILWEGDSGGAGGGAGGDPPASDPPKKDPPASDPPKQDDPPGPVPYERFKQVNDQLQAQKAKLEALEAAQKAAAEKEAAEQGKWQELAEKREAELKEERLKRTRLEVASKKGIPPDLAERLQGETAEDMAKDAEALLQFLKPKEGPGVPPAGKGGSPQPMDLAKMSPEEIRKAAKGKSINDLVE